MFIPARSGGSLSFADRSFVVTMVAKRGAGSGSNGRKAPCRQSVKAREVKKAADAAKPRRQQSFAVVKQDGGGSVLKSSTVKSTASVAEDNLTAITQSALAELIICLACAVLQSSRQCTMYDAAFVSCRNLWFCGFSDREGILILIGTPCSSFEKIYHF